MTMQKPPTTTSTSKLEPVLVATFDKARLLLDCLESEHRALQNQVMNTLDDIILEKNELVKQLESLDKQRAEITHINLSNNTKNGNNMSELPMSELLRGLDTSGKLEELWKDIQEILSDCKQANLRNGQLLQRMGQSTAEVLNALLPRDESASSTYSASGSAAPAISPRNISEA